MSARTRLVRALGFDHNPMRRRIDRVEAWITVVLLLLVLVIVPLLTTVTMLRSYHNGVRAEQTERADRRLVTATVVSGPKSLSDGSTDSGVSEVVNVGWLMPDHTAEQATVAFLPGDKIGTHRRLWVSKDGTITVKPRDRAQTVSDTVLAGLFAATAVILPIAGVHALVRSRLDRRRMAAWEADWARTAPLWIRNR